MITGTSFFGLVSANHWLTITFLFFLPYFILKTVSNIFGFLLQFLYPVLIYLFFIYLFTPNFKLYLEINTCF